MAVAHRRRLGIKYWGCLYPLLTPFQEWVGVGFLRIQAAPLHQLGGLGSAVSSSSVVWGRASAEIEFGAF